MLPPTVHLVTDRRATPDLVRTVRAALVEAPPASVMVHVREKDLGGGALLALSRAVGAACRAAGQLFVVNDRLDVALASGADGVHLPAAGVPAAEARRLLGAGRFVGVSCHSAEDVSRAAHQGADYATFSPIYDTPSKRAYGPPVGLVALRDAARLGLPLVALGGVDVGNAPEVVAAGARGVAAIRAWVGADDPARTVTELLRVTRESGSGTHGAHHGHGRRHGNPDDLVAYVARMESADRAEWQQPDAVIRELQVQPGETIADVGAGPGYFSLRLAKAVGSHGRVYAVEVVPEIAAVLRERIDRAGVANVTPILGAPDDPHLPPQSCDLILLVNTFHHFPDGVDYLARLASALKPGGRLVDVDFHKRELPVGPPVEHKVAREDFLAAAREAGLEPQREITSLPYQYFVVLGRAAGPRARGP